MVDSALNSLWPSSSTADDLAVFMPQRGTTVRVFVSHAEETPRWLPYVMGRLRELLHLQFDTEEAMSLPRDEAIRRVLPELIRFMRVDTPTPSVVPTFDGGVQFVWHKGGWDVEVEVGPKQTLVWAQHRDGSISWHGSLDDRVGDVRAVLSEITALA